MTFASFIKKSFDYVSNIFGYRPVDDIKNVDPSSFKEKWKTSYKKNVQNKNNDTINVFPSSAKNYNQFTKSIIDKEYENISFNFTEESKNKNSGYIYIFSIIFDGKICLKLGYTKKDPAQRNWDYLYKEYKNTPKLPKTFRLLALCKYDDQELARRAETFFKTKLKRHPLNKDQQGNIEQYKFYDSWSYLEKEFINKLIFDHYTFLLSDKLWIRENILDTYDYYKVYKC